MQQGWDPEVKKFFVRIINSIALGLIWMIAGATAGLYYELGYGKGIYTVLFYTVMVISLVLLIVYLRHLWKDA